MKKIIFTILVVTIVMLSFPALFFAEPDKYLSSESSSYGLVISSQAKQEAVKAKADRQLLYQDEIDIAGEENLELKTTETDVQSDYPASTSDNSPDLGGISSDAGKGSIDSPDTPTGGPGCTAGECAPPRQFGDGD
ncbi:MAG TPA: hypothetical protein PLC32_05765 [Candidatus Omnitrophota bacterium]|nr:hypothetical protein [Candidatus Omnitrophota bacterium]